jgi:hypothetical protein
VESEEEIAASVREAARRAGGTVTRERYEVVIFEREAPWRSGQGVRVRLVSVEPSRAGRLHPGAYGGTVAPR